VSAKQFKYCFEDFRVGMVIEQPGPTLTRDDILEFARRYDAAAHAPRRRSREALDLTAD